MGKEPVVEHVADTEIPVFEKLMKLGSGPPVLDNTISLTKWPLASEYKGRTIGVEAPATTV